MPISAAINAGAATANTLINQAFTKSNRRENYLYNEKAANNADLRQRKQYHDLYSPQAMLDQYRAAGLSPSLMMSGGAPAVGQSSAQGNQSAGIQGPYPNAQVFDPLAAAQMANIIADTEGKQIDNTVKSLESKLRESMYILEKAEIELMSTYLINEETKQSESLMTAAGRFNKYEEFINYVKNDINVDSNDSLKYYVDTQAGQKTMQDIYYSAHNIDKVVTQIEGDKEYANIMLEVYTKLSEGEFAKMTAEQRLSELKKITEQNNLEADKKETINKIFEGIENENLRAFAMVLYMIADRYLGSVSASYSANRGINTNTNTNSSTSHNYNTTNSTSTNTNYNYRR